MKDQQPEALTKTIDRLSLEQALLDADVAIARAHDLALRLVEMRRQLADERARNLLLSSELEASRATYDELVSNRAYQLARTLGALRRAVRG